MATVYVDSGASGADDGTSWANAHEQIHATSFTSADIVYVASRHVEAHTGSDMSLTCGSEVNGGALVISVTTGTTTYEPMRDSTGSISLVSSANDIDFNQGGSFFGLKFETDSTASNILVNTNNIQAIYFEDCDFVLGGTTHYFGVNQHAIFNYMVNCSFTYEGSSSDTGEMLHAPGTTQTHFYNPTFSGVTYKDYLFKQSKSSPILIGADLSSCGTAGGGFNLTSNRVNLTGGAGPKLFACKLPTTWAMYPNETWTNWGQPAAIIDSDNATDNNRFNLEYDTGPGDITVVDDVYIAGGYQPNDASNPISWYISYLNASTGPWVFYHAPQLTVYNTTTGSVTITVELLVADSSSTSAPTDANIFAYITYLGAAASTQATALRTGVANPLDTPANLAAGADGWTETGAAANTDSYKISETVTVNREGPITVQVCVGSLGGNEELYINPKIDLS